MRIQATVTRPHYYDRNPITGILRYTGSGIAPHVPTLRASYTCPAGKRAWVEAAYVSLWRGAVAGVASWARCTVNFIPVGLGGHVLLEAWLFTNGLYDHDRASLSGIGLMVPGDAVQIVTADASTGGTLSYDATVKLFEFDA